MGWTCLPELSRTKKLICAARLSRRSFKQQFLLQQGKAVGVTDTHSASMACCAMLACMTAVCVSVRRQVCVIPRRRACGGSDTDAAAAGSPDQWLNCCSCVALLWAWCAASTPTVARAPAETMPACVVTCALLSNSASFRLVGDMTKHMQRLIGVRPWSLTPPAAAPAVAQGSHLSCKAHGGLQLQQHTSHIPVVGPAMDTALPHSQA